MGRRGGAYRVSTHLARVAKVFCFVGLVSACGTASSDAATSSTGGTPRPGIESWGTGEDLGFGIELVRSPLSVALDPMIEITYEARYVNPVEDGSALSFMFVGSKAYDPTDPCTRQYTVGVDESADRVDLWLHGHDRESDAICDGIGYRRPVRVALDVPLGQRVVRTWSRVDREVPGYVVVQEFVSEPE